MLFFFILVHHLARVLQSGQGRLPNLVAQIRIWLHRFQKIFSAQSEDFAVGHCDHAGHPGLINNQRNLTEVTAIFQVTNLEKHFVKNLSVKRKPSQLLSRWWCRPQQSPRR
jgi:hypothetical protein